MSLAGRLLADERGTTAVLTAFSLAGLLGFVALGMEAARGLHMQRTLQTAADAAARAGALALRAGGAANPAREAAALAADLASGAEARVAWPPRSGPHARDPLAIEVELARPQTPVMAAFLGGSGGGAVRARAVARLEPMRAGCILALRPGLPGTIATSRPADLLLEGCEGLSAAAGIPELRLAEADPYRHLLLPAPSGCTVNALRVSGRMAVPGGQTAVFCNGLAVVAGGELVLGPGVHVVDGGLLTVQPGGTLVADGATVILRGTGGRRPAVANILPGARVVLRAPPAGPTAGLAMASSGEPAPSHALASPGLAVTGAIYLPGSTLRFAGNGSGGCAQLIADQVAIAGPTRLRASCPGTGMAPILDRVARLVE